MDRKSVPPECRSAVNKIPCILWRKPPQKNLFQRLDQILDRQGEDSKPKTVFFRADDIAVPGPGFDQLLDLFIKHETPLNLAVVPAWLTLPRWRKLKEKSAPGAGLWCWHQHGWRHINHEPSGKKQEFGPSRTRQQLRDDLQRGRNRLEKIIGADFSPIFTPPWNRCSRETLTALSDLNYTAVSRGSADEALPAGNLPEFNVHVDLHTRKETNIAEAWDNLFHELSRALQQDHCGIMLHHQRMNHAAFLFLEILLQLLKTGKGIRVKGFKDLQEPGTMTKAIRMNSAHADT